MSAILNSKSQKSSVAPEMTKVKTREREAGGKREGESEHMREREKERTCRNKGEVTES